MRYIGISNLLLRRMDEKPWRVGERVVRLPEGGRVFMNFSRELIEVLKLLYRLPITIVRAYPSSQVPKLRRLQLFPSTINCSTMPCLRTNQTPFTPRIRPTIHIL